MKCDTPRSAQWPSIRLAGTCSAGWDGTVGFQSFNKSEQVSAQLVSCDYDRIYTCKPGIQSGMTCCTLERGPQGDVPLAARYDKVGMSLCQPQGWCSKCRQVPPRLDVLQALGFQGRRCRKQRCRDVVEKEAISVLQAAFSIGALAFAEGFPDSW
ncbi:unnamed protein product [Effrenium voratum]|uniref:Uncharacterized protein n=1 Tax=Effrenium voratum TaxID=2562239 RepID=A0AA36NFP5_9DINO|nr:unnamed protein product [Effrenium voratum]CAJ1448616.1 unnamed protein product [Effrenium voratum]